VRITYQLKDGELPICKFKGSEKDCIKYFVDEEGNKFHSSSKELIQVPLFKVLSNPTFDSDDFLSNNIYSAGREVIKIEEAQKDLESKLLDELEGDDKNILVFFRTPLTILPFTDNPKGPVIDCKSVEDIFSKAWGA